MFVMTAKLNKTKLIAIFVAIALLVVVLVAVLNGSGSEPEPQAVESNSDRITFLEGKGWQVAEAPVETQQVKIPTESTQVFDRYNALQISQGYDLSQYSGKQVMRYVYEVTNYPGAEEPVYATMFIYKNQVIGGDVTSTAADGCVHGFSMPAQLQRPAPAPSEPAEQTELENPAEPAPAVQTPDDGSASAVQSPDPNVDPDTQSPVDAPIDTPEAP